MLSANVLFLFLIGIYRAIADSELEATILPVNEPICPSGQINVSTNSFRCFSQQCANFSNGIKCPTEGTIEIISSAGCTCQPGYAYINETDCVPVNSIECGGKGYFWNGSLIEKTTIVGNEKKVVTTRKDAGGTNISTQTSFI